jgi:hypothetical protein
MPFTGDSFAHLFDWEKDPQRQEKIVNARLEAEFDGIDSGLSAVATELTTLEGRTSASATQRIFARKTAGAGAYEECTISEVLDFIGSAAQGDILYRGAAGWARLAAGTSGKFLQTKGSGNNPVWAYPEIVVKGGIEAVNNSTTLQDDNHLLFPVAANETVFFLLNLKHVENGATNADIKIAFTGPAGLADGQLVPINGIKVNETDSIVLQGAINIGGGASAMSFGASTASRYAQCIGFIQNGATAGNVVIQWAQNTAQAHDMYVQAGSAIIIWRI